MNKDLIQCNWTELDKDKKLVQCQNFGAIKDEENMTEKYVCILHLKEIMLTRFKMYLKMKKLYEG